MHQQPQSLQRRRLPDLHTQHSASDLGWGPRIRVSHHVFQVCVRFLGAALIKDRKLRGLKQQECLYGSSGGCRSKNKSLSGSRSWWVREATFLPPLPPCSPCSPWCPLVAAASVSPCVSSHGPPPANNLSLSKFPLYIKRPITTGHTQLTSFYLVYLHGDTIPNQSHILKYWG